ncbi:aaa family atpase protein [Rhypophila decipiens]|uniref:Aaa family atpase protein n=1 Tax=Rhypophila decipiens TaxID=261697 RepID=A0AAN6XY72_9PEZI|nr:aaa family atpase protein [Rhypophila decipiens]
MWDRLHDDLYRDQAQRKAQNTTIPVLTALAEHFGGLEDRVKKLEDENKKFRLGARKPTQNAETDTPPDLTVKFYDAAGHIDKNGKFQDVHEGAEPGTYMCEEDPRYLIRVLYAKLNDGAQASDEDDNSTAPDPEHVDILTFGVLSKPVSAFFENIFGIEFENGDLVRFGKPFRPLIRHYHDLRKHLAKLEQKYGMVPGRPYSSPDTSQLYVPEAGVGHDERSPSVIPLLLDDGKDNLAPSYDRPSAITHFQLLLDFVDKYLGKQVQLFDCIRNGQEDRVAFKDLWMVFDTQDIIISPVRDTEQKSFRNTLQDLDHKQIKRFASQAYQVVATTGGMPFTSAVRNTTQMDTSEEKAQKGEDGTEGSGFKSSKGIRGSYSDLVVYCFSLDFNGIEFGAVREVFVFKPYELKMDVSSLQVYPVRHPRRGNFLLERGRHFASVTEVSHLQYEGLTAGSTREDINSPVVIDMKLAYESETNGIDAPKFAPLTTFWIDDNSSMEAFDLLGKPTCSNQWCYDGECLVRLYVTYQMGLRNTMDHKIKPTLEQYSVDRDGFTQLLETRGLIQLLPGVVPGFALRNRKWVLLDLSLLGEIKEKNEWKSLVLPKGHQRMVQAMVETYTDVRGHGSFRGMDLVSGKGEGCIILLHGVPGVGKTSTAECVAAHTNKPLYPITCGDIGVTPEAVESNMERHFKLAHKWGCVLLLDEADVFLAKRDQRDVVRNGLVSVFLRILEYYSGILFLTTNRVGAIDDAFRSRLHLQLYYPKLTKSQTNKIFIKNFEQVEAINQDRIRHGLPIFEYSRHQKKILSWAEKNFNTLSWNGRQIRNGFQTVLALAEFEIKKSSVSRKKGGSEKSPVMNLDLFKIVAEASLQFNRYLKETHGFEENMLAYQDKVRADPGEMLGTIGTSSGHGGRGKTDEPVLEDPTDMSTTSESGSESGEESEEEDETGSGQEGSDQDIDEDSQSSSGDERKRKKVKKEKGKTTIKERKKVSKGKDRVKDDRRSSSKTRGSGSKKKAVSGKSTSGKKNTKVKVKEEEPSENLSSGSESE